MDIKFTIIEGEILRNGALHGDEKILISIIRNFTKNGGVFFGKIDWLSDQIGRSKEQTEILVKKLIKKEILIFDGENLKFTVDNEDLLNILKRLKNGKDNQLNN